MNTIPDYVKIFFLAMAPIGELRISIPVAIGSYNMPWQSALLWSFLGNIIPGIALLYLLEPASNFLIKNFRFFKKFFNWLFERTRRRHVKRFEIWGSLALVAFIAIPLPMTGAWTGAAAAFVFGIKPKKAVPLVMAGALLAGAIVTIIAIGVKIMLIR